MKRLGWLVVAGAMTGVACGGSTPTPAVDGGSDVGVSDAGGTDAGGTDAGTDIGRDTGPTDTGPTDTGPTDTGPTDTGPTDTGPTDASDGGSVTVRTAATNGTAVAVTHDDSTAVAANRTAGSIAVFALQLGAAPPRVVRTAVLPVPGGEPWATVIGNDDDTAYVVLRHDRQVVKVTGLHGTPALGPTRASTGSEPTGIAISPTGARLYVANAAEGTVTVVNTADMTVATTVDLNASLAGTGFLGTVAARPGLAHPRALVVTNNGDTSDADETVYVTEFFSQARTAGVPTDDTGFDLGRQGVVYRFNAVSGVVAAPITIAPVANTGFADSDGSATGCFPNQLYAAAISNNRLYVTAVCASPRGPVNVVPPAAAGGAADARNVKTQVHAAIFVIDTASNAEVPAQGILLTQKFQSLYDTASVPDDGTRRIPLIPNSLAFVPGTSIGYVTGYGSDAVFRVRYNPDGSFAEVGSSTARFINTGAATAGAGKLPIGIAVTASGAHALVLNENTRNLSAVSFALQDVVTVAAAADAPTGADQIANDGHRLFVTGLARWSLKGQGWNSCESCHPDGLTDGVTWFFLRGPRQTISLDGTFDAAGHQRMLNWGAIFDEVHDFELNTRGNSGGVGALVSRVSAPPSPADRLIFDGTVPVPPQVATATRQDGLNGSTRQMMPDGTGAVRSVLADFASINAWVQTIRSPRAPVGLSTTDVTAGMGLFAANNCAGCHGGPAWTVSRRFYTPGESTNALLLTSTWTRPAGFPAALAPASSTFRPSPFNPAIDQVTCALRTVGTFPGTLDGMQSGVAPSGVRVREVRANGNAASPASMSVAAQGATGFNPPALVNMSSSGPYFHAGNARTLEEVFAPTFVAHYTALSSNFLESDSSPAARAQHVQQIVAFLLSIDDGTSTIAPPTLAGGVSADLCPLTFP